MCIDAPVSTSHSRSSGLFEVGAGITLDSIGAIESGFIRILDLVNVFRQVPRCFAGASFLGARSPHVIFPRILARKDHAHEAHTFG